MFCELAREPWNRIKNLKQHNLYVNYNPYLPKWKNLYQTTKCLIPFFLVYPLAYGTCVSGQNK